MLTNFDATTLRPVLDHLQSNQNDPNSINSPNFNIVKEIGQKEGWSYRDNMTLRASEGVICTYTNKEIKKEKKFWRFVDDKLYEVGTTYDLGFPKDDLS